MNPLRLLLFFIVFSSIYPVFAQTPNAFNYQGVARDSDGVLMNNKNITFRVSLLSNGQNGDIAYQETHFITTSTYGGFSLSIGRGNVQEATFEDLDWSSNSYNLKIEFDANDGSGFDELGTSEILSVPYALYSMASSTVIMPLEISYDKINVSCNGGSNGHINLDISGGNPPYSIEWITGETSAFIENLSAGNYSVAVTDSDGFISTKSIVIEEQALLSISIGINDVLCYGINDGYINVSVTGGVSPYIYQWNDDNNSNSRTDLSGGIYEVTVTDNNGCTISESITISSSSEIEVSFETIMNDCYGDANGSIVTTVTGGVEPYSYRWTGSGINVETKDITGLKAGVYNLLIADGNECQINKSVTITENNPISISLVSNEAVKCKGESTGSLEVEISGGVEPYIYLWSDGTTNQNLSNAIAEEHTLIVTDANGCQGTNSWTIGETSTSIVIEINSVLPSYLSEANGSIDITVSGATLPYIYSWSNGSANEDLINVVGGLYTITVTDDLGCVLDENITVDDKTTLVDIDGNSYNLKKFGSNIWITENLKTTRDRFGGQITFHNPNNDPVNTDDFGPLYWTNSVNNSFCPLNWRVATDLDWQDLEIFLGMSPVQAGASGLRGMTEGDDSKEGGAAGFNAKYSGYRTSS